MKYIPSYKMKGTGVHYESIEFLVPWVIADGTLDQLTKEFALGEKKRVVDIGCGNGKALAYFRDTADSLHGLDLNNYLDDSIKDSVEFSVSDLNFDALPYADASKDLVCAFQMVEHLENPFHVMREAHRVLEKDGIFIFSVPNPYTLSTKLRYLFHGNHRRWTRKNDHLLFLTKDVFAKTYGAHFDVCTVRYQKGMMPFVGRILNFLGIKLQKNSYKILPRVEMFGDAMCYVLRKK